MFHPELNLLAQLAAFGVDDTRDGTYISLKNVHRAFIVVCIGQGADATAHTVTLKQATGGAGTTTGTAEKALGTVNVYYNETTWLASNLLTAGTAAVGAYTFGADQSRGKVLVFDIVPERDMDVANGFDCISIDFSDLGAANCGGAFAILLPPRYAPLATVYSD
ncbi:MAG: hypothetical protein EHM49_08960 [Deltaproteobacteria bacterium]|nr:MAG: hypothetical protein EHM49_08960 [Deltaproteobacteria bacterium]